MRGLVVVLLVATATAARAYAEEAPDPTVVLVGADPAFAEALRDVLVTNAVNDVGARPAPPLGEVATESRRLADEQRAIATVWLVPATSGATLVTYDRERDRFLVRELAYALPLTPTQAAEAARMVRTMLRALRTDDDASIAKAVQPPRNTPPREPPPRVMASIALGAWFAAPEAAALPQASLAIAWRPYGLGAALGVTVAPAADIATPSFTGDVRDIVLALEVRNALRVTPQVRVTPGLGLAGHVVLLAGHFNGSGDPVASDRFNPALRTSVTAGYALPRLEIGLGVSADCLLVRQRYEAGSERILLVPRVQVVAAAFAGIRL